MTENYSHHADILLFNGDIHGMDIPGNVQQAIAVHHERILATGSNGEILPLAGPQTQHIDLQGRTVLPGLIDGHMHPWWGAKLLAGFRLNYESLTQDETMARIATTRISHGFRVTTHLTQFRRHRRKKPYSVLH
ncbi:amidohydrolase family protein [Citrobacter braakii]|nr:amidohydrolase family protein [Citrobacter braakii]